MSWLSSLILLPKVRIMATTQELLQQHKDEVCKLFRQAVRARMTQWDCEQAIEDLINHELNTSEIIGVLAAEFPSTMEVDGLAEAVILDAVEENLARPALNPPSRET